jgi:hypothetical protein
MSVRILDQLELVREHPRVALFAAAQGAIMPVGAFWTSHFDLSGFDVLRPTADPKLAALVVVTMACLAFSVTTVWGWQYQSTGSGWKATTFVIGVEGLMVFSPTTPLAIVALSLLIGINAIATACTNVNEKAAEPAAPKTVTELSRALNVPRAKAAKVLDRQLAAAKTRPA